MDRLWRSESVGRLTALPEMQGCWDAGDRASATALFPAQDVPACIQRQMMYTIEVHYREITTLLCDFIEVPPMTYMVSERPDPRGHDTDNSETDSELVEYVDSDVSDE